MITYLEFTDVRNVPFYLMCNSGFRGSAMLCLETINYFGMHFTAIFRVSLRREGEVYQRVGLAVRVKMGWSVVISWKKKVTWLRERV